MARLVNIATASGTHNGGPASDTATATVFTSVILIEKEADKPIWDDDSDLTYTINISNVDPDDPPAPIVNPVFTDTIDPGIATLIAGSVMNGTTPLTAAADPANPAIGEYGYNEDTGLLIIPLADIAVGSDVTITFLVEKAT